jgi:hypothetical protein
MLLSDVRLARRSFSTDSTFSLSNTRVVSCCIINARGVLIVYITGYGPRLLAGMLLDNGRDIIWLIVEANIIPNWHAVTSRTLDGGILIRFVLVFFFCFRNQTG